jgi:MFS family permease
MFGVICGPLLGPIVGGFLIMSSITWRATFWFCFAFGIIIFLFTFFFTPETYRDNGRFDAELPTINEKVGTTLDKEQTVNTEIDATHTMDTASERTVVVTKKKARVNPFAAFALFPHPFILMSSVTGGLFFGAMFATETILPSAFSQVYRLSAWQTGLRYLGAGIGNLSRSVVGSRLSDRLLLRSRMLRGGASKSEDRLTHNIWIAGFIFKPLDLLIFGWVVQHQLSYWGAIIGFGIQCFGNVQVITTITAYLVVSVPAKGASATAAANFVRFAFPSILSAISSPMINGLGPGWTSTLFACLSVFGMFLMIILKIWGESIRRYSNF